jgi:hypothetical protein
MQAASELSLNALSAGRRCAHACGVIHSACERTDLDKLPRARNRLTSSMPRHVSTIAIVALSTFALCASAQEAFNPAATTAAKRALIPLFAGAYAQECGKSRGNEMPMPRSGSPISFGAGGVISWNGRSVDLLKSYLNEFTVGRSASHFAMKTDVQHVTSGDNILVAGLTYQPGKPSGASVTFDNATDNQVGGVCLGAAPAGAATSLWPVAVRLLAYPKHTLSCMDLKKRAPVKADVLFDGQRLTIGPYSYPASAAANEESLSVSDSGFTLSYTFGTNGQMVIVTMQPDGKQRHFQVTPTNDPLAGFSCDD